MNPLRWLSVLFVIMALAGCAEGAPGQTQVPYTAYSPENVHDRGGDM